MPPHGAFAVVFVAVCCALILWYRRSKYVDTTPVRADSSLPSFAAAALKNIEIIERERLCERSAAMGDRLLTALKSLTHHPIVGDVRGVGLMCAVELIRDRKTGAKFLGRARADNVRDAVGYGFHKIGSPHFAQVVRRPEVTSALKGTEGMVLPGASQDPDGWPGYLFTGEPLRLPAGPFGLGHGDGAHAPNEYFLIESAQPRVQGIDGAARSYVELLYAMA
jgi:hypothetical protein